MLSLKNRRTKKNRNLDLKFKLLDFVVKYSRNKYKTV
jgi:hypothetical protein